MKVGIAVTTTPCREGIFIQWLEHYKKHVPNIPLYIHNDEQYNGIVYSKNKCLEALWQMGVDHLFLFDDDTFIQSPDFIDAYCNSGLNHACWNYNRRLVSLHATARYNITSDDTTIFYYNEYDKPNGCMLYAKRSVLHKAGGWDTDFRGYGFDHVNWSDRIFNNGLTPARYIDIPDSKHLFKMADCDTSVSYSIRATTIPINERLYKEKFYSKEFKPFK